MATDTHTLPDNLDQLAQDVADAAVEVAARKTDLSVADRAFRDARQDLVHAETTLANARQALDNALTPVTPGGAL